MSRSMTNQEFMNLFESEESIFFIQIGANNGVTVDPINRLLKTKPNWTGILFEPGTEAFQELQHTYENFKNFTLVNSAVSNIDGTTILYCGETTPHFTLDRIKAQHMFNIEPKEVLVDVVSPKTIISQYNISDVGLLQIDTEGRDFTIIKSFFENGIFPKIIRFEYVNLYYEGVTESRVVDYLSDYGYTSHFVENDGDIVSILKTTNQLTSVSETNNNRKKIKVHRFSNNIWGRAHLPFFKRFEKFLNEKFDVETVDYNQDGETFTGHINTLRPIYPFDNNPPLSDVDCVIENKHNGEIKVLSFGEYFNSYVCHLAKSEHCSKVLLAHFNWHNLYYWMKKEYATKEMYKVKPWIFLPYQEFDYKKYRILRNQSDGFDDKMFFLGGGLNDYRRCIKIIEESGYLQNTSSLNHSDYLERLSNSKIAISYYQNLDRYRTPFDYPGELCYRDVEYMSLGVPFIRIEFKDTCHDPWIPNFHYISIPRELAHIAYEKDGDQGIANLYIEKYNEVVNDDFLLNYISKNQIDWFDKNIASPNIEQLTYDLLELDEWYSSKSCGLYNQSISNSNETEKKKMELISESNEESVDYHVENINSNLEKLDSTYYKGFLAQQQKDAMNTFKTFLSDIRPARILEIGTAGGGLTLFLRDTLDELGLTQSKIKSFDIRDCHWYDKLRTENIEINILNIFSDDYTKLERPELITDFIQSEGTTLVLCDGGNKVFEFNLIAPLIKVGDFIMAHDYVDTTENFEKKFKNKIWNWCEIQENDISDISEKENLIHYDKEEFDKIVWVCKEKINI